MTPATPDDQIRDQVRRIAASAGFVAADSIRRFLDFTVEKTLSGHGDEIKEFTIGLEVFGRKASFDPHSDSIVRVQARKLRERLHAYYESEGAHDPIRIEYRKGSYIPSFAPATSRATSTSLDAAPQRSLAVLPFVNLTPGEDGDNICDAITEELIFLLSRVEGLPVVSRSSCFALRRSTDDVRSIARKLNADLIVEGSVRRSGDRVRVTAQLINAGDGYHLWSERWERGAESVVHIQDEIAAAIAKSLRPRLSPASMAPAPRDAEAYRLFLKGRYFWNQRTEHGFQRAIEHYQAAIGRDPGFARAWAALAETYVLVAAHQLEAPSYCLPKAREAALTALKLDARLASGHSALAAILMSFDRDMEGAHREWKVALDIDPNYAWVWHSLAVFGMMQGRPAESLAALREAQRLEPLSPAIANDFAFVHYLGRQFEEAIQCSRAALDLHPYFHRTRVGLARAHAALGLHKEAVEICQEARLLFVGRAFLNSLLAILGYSFGRLGRHAEAQAVLAEFKEIGRRNYVSRYDVAMVQVGQRRFADALDTLEESYRQRDFWIIDWPREPLLDDLRQEPRFLALCEAVQAPAGPR